MLCSIVMDFCTEAKHLHKVKHVHKCFAEMRRKTLGPPMMLASISLEHTDGKDKDHI